MKLSNRPTLSKQLGRWLLPACLALSSYGLSAESAAPQRHALAMHGEPAYAEGFTHFDYARPDAPKGGEMRQAQIGTFDTLNGFLVKGTPAAGLGYLYDTLMHSSEDEAFTMYGLLAERIEMPEDRSWVRYHLNPRAKFHDGKPVTAADVVFSFNTLVEQGQPHFRSYYADVKSVKAEDDKTVYFDLGTGHNKELPLILGQFPVLPKHFWEGKDFSKADLTQPMGSGPYKIAKVDPGRSITYELNPDYWGKDLPVNKGRFNFGEIIYEYYRDTTVAFEAFKAGEFDFRLENTAKLWATGYTGGRFDNGTLIKEEIDNDNPQGMQGFWLNLRRDKFQDVRVRQALALMFDFEWTNKKLFYGAYTRSYSFFTNSELSSNGVPQGKELAALEPYREKLPAEVFNSPYQPPMTDGSGNIRPQMRQALGLLKEAGWQLKDGKLVDANGKQMEIEFLVYSNTFERVIQPYRKNLSRLGIKSELRLVDISQFINRLNEFDFDVVSLARGQSLSPGSEQLSFWGSEYANVPGSQNWSGVSDPVVDELIDQLIASESREDLIVNTQALDRVLLAKHFVIPQWHLSSYRVAYHKKLHRPEKTPSHSLALDTWWIE